MSETLMPCPQLPERRPVVRPDPPESLAALRARVRALEGGGLAAGPRLPLGVAGLDDALPGGGLPLGCLHEVRGDPGDGASIGFTAALAARLAQQKDAGHVLWLAVDPDLYAPGLLDFGLDPARLLLAAIKRSRDLPWAVEEAARCPGLAAAVAALPALDPIASRRLQLACEAGGVTVFLLTRQAMAGATATTRWAVAARPAPPARVRAPDPPSWSVRLERCRGGRPGAWTLAWDGRARVFQPIPHPTPAVSVPPAPAGHGTERPQPAAAVPGTAEQTRAA